MILKLSIFVNTIVQKKPETQIVALLNYSWPLTLQEKCKMVSTLTSPLTGTLNFIGILTTENDLRGVDILRNDVYAILKQIMNLNFMKNNQAQD